ncbi:DUF3888 domain-containing protein [Tenuibacillus multivorans]|uniref:DUF3888 domain-containing protein n=1 Tax=Tenuibacillus multivorans TaxID=237069 RepID=UPI000B85967C|nr:DUF3888 domain-containing protein [Tenuibacillus multivorans]GEL77801.1 hypothetical protein TMU01_20360 [Tenuibacillus multivorans]
MTNHRSFVIIIEIDSFVGAHNTIGTDELKFVRKDDVQLINYKHTPSPNKEKILEFINRKSS